MFSFLNYFLCKFMDVFLHVYSLYLTIFLDTMNIFKNTELININW